MAQPKLTPQPRFFQEFGRLFREFLHSPSERKCVYCADEAGHITPSGKSRRVLASRVVQERAARYGHDLRLENVDFDELGVLDSGSHEAVLHVRVHTKRLGARLDDDCTPPKNSVSSSVSVEPAMAGAHKSYRNEGKQERQVALFPKLLEEVAERRAALEKGYDWPDYKSRRTPEFRAALAAATADRIGGTPQEARRYFDEVLAKYPECFWIDGCAAPLVRDHVISFRLKEGAKPVARQPIPVSPYDDTRVEFHIEENVKLGKLRKIDARKEGLPEWSTPVFVVDQDAKGVLGRLVCAYGPVNKELEISTFPSADPTRAFALAAFKEHHTVVDAIWGYTQFQLDEATRRVLVICSRSGLYEWLRVPFGPAPAPAQMQSYVAQRFGALRNTRGQEFASPCMDDILVSSATLEEHVDDCQCLCKSASGSGFEFKARKGQYNQKEIEFWGCICDAQGRRVQPRKVKQLSEWPEPKSSDAVNSFLCFVNYLREYLEPTWLKWEQVLKPFRKKTADFGI